MKIISCSEARKLGKKYYFTGKPCKHGHIDRRAVVNGTCVTCVNKNRRVEFLNPESRERRNKLHCEWLKKRGHASWQRAKRNRDPIKYMIKSSRHNSKKRNIIHSITRKDFPKDPPTHCPVLGIELNYIGGTKTAVANTASLERIDNNRGYIPGNVMIVSYRANLLRNNASSDELQRVADFWKERGF